MLDPIQGRRDMCVCVCCDFQLINVERTQVCSVYTLCTEEARDRRFLIGTWGAIRCGSKCSHAARLREFHNTISSTANGFMAYDEHYDRRGILISYKYVVRNDRNISNI